jgi:hypothetical protein
MDLQFMKDAITDQPEPIPGYLLDEIVQQTFISCQHCEAIEKQILKFLSSVSPHVLCKTLRLIKELCLRGHVSFRSDMKMFHSQLRTCTAYAGFANSPLYGDALNRSVRELAHDCIEMVLSATPAISESNTRVHKTADRSRIVGFGINEITTQAGSIPPASASSAYFSNLKTLAREYTPSYVHTTLASTAAYFFPTLSSNPAPHKTYLPPPHPPEVTHAVDGVHCENEVQVFEYSQTSLPNYCRAQYRPPRLGMRGMPSTTHCTPDTMTSSVPEKHKPKIKLTPMEKRLARVLLVPKNGELRPKREEMISLCEQLATSGDASEASVYLDQHLQLSHPWRTRLRTLYTIHDTLLRSWTCEGHRAFKAYFKTHPENIHRLTKVIQSSVTKMATEVLQCLARSDSHRDPSTEESAPAPLPSPRDQGDLATSTQSE